MQSEESKLLNKLINEKTKNINIFFKKIKKETFADCLNELLKSKNLERKDLYNELCQYLSHTYIYELGTFSTKEQKKQKIPSRQVVLAIGIAVGASQEEINKLLKGAGYIPLNKRDREDFDVIRGIHQGWEKERMYDTIKLYEKKRKKNS